MSNLIKNFKSVVYSLKRAYGQSVTVCRPTTPSINRETGAVTRTVTSTVVKRAIVLLSDRLRDTVIPLGGYFDRDKNIVIIDQKDLTADPTLNDYITIGTEDWEIKNVKKLSTVYYVLEIITTVAEN